MRIGVAGVLLAWLAVLTRYDIAERRLPNGLTLSGAAVIVLGAAVAGRGLAALAGAAALAGVYLLVHLAAPAAMGAGDVKLAIGLGGLTGCFGAEVWFLAALAAPLLTALWGVVTRLCGGAGATTVPHGPAMCLASAAAAALAVF
jgi:leader peptidase (prepilin peptidase) / N-methyltransferase